MSTFFVVATPIGNLEDVTARARRVLAEVAVAFAEDTRRTRILFEHLGVRTPLRSLHEHNERARVQVVLAELDRGVDVALVSDAGTPAVSDPGAVIVEAVLASSHRVSPIPGPSALAAALSVAGFGDSSRRACFVGFLPVKGKERTAAVGAVEAETGLVILYESPHRIGETLAELAAADPARLAVVCRELTKVHEEVRRGTLAELAAWAAGEVRGELTIVLGPKAPAQVTAGGAAVDPAIRRCLAAGLSARDTATAVAAVLEVSKREIYQRVQELARASEGS